jgi:hypothetical protein
VILAALFLAAWGYVWAYDRIKVVRLDEMFSPKYGWPVGARDQYFASKFPSSAEIEAYLSNATILFSHPPTDNIVFYFGNNRQFISWFDQSTSVGKWSISPHLRIILLGQQWQAAVIYVFCSHVAGLPNEAQQDSCREVERLDSIFSQGRDARREYQKGDVFNLQDNQEKIGPLPKVDISISSVLATQTGSAKE